MSTGVATRLALPHSVTGRLPAGTPRTSHGFRVIIHGVNVADRKTASLTWFQGCFVQRKKLNKHLLTMFCTAALVSASIVIRFWASSLLSAQEFRCELPLPPLLRLGVLARRFLAPGHCSTLATEVSRASSRDADLRGGAPPPDEEPVRFAASSFCDRLPCYWVFWIFVHKNPALTKRKEIPT